MPSQNTTNIGPNNSAIMYRWHSRQVRKQETRNTYQIMNGIFFLNFPHATIIGWIFGGPPSPALRMTNMSGEKYNPACGDIMHYHFG